MGIRKAILLFSLIFLVSNLPAQLDQLMPVPQTVVKQEGKFRLSKTFTLNLEGPEGSRTEAAATRFLQRLDAQTNLMLPDFAEKKVASEKGLTVKIKRTGKLEVHEDESYTLTVNKQQVQLAAETDLGAMHGLETLLQLLDSDGKGYFFPACKIEDAPRFPWRGLLIDVCRHWEPVEVIKRNLDGMAAMKMNVFHWHLSEDQGFRIESKVFPRLHEMGSNGNYFTQEQVKDIVAYADARGIRVIPEFDMPGHATAWFVGHPELASAPGPYAIEKGYGVFDPTIDVTKESTYTFLDAFLTEMCQLFPDAYFHIGGDENNGKHWDKNADIQAFMKQNNLKDNHALQSYFNQKILKILTRNGKRMVGWDEILQDDSPKDIVIQSWRGKEALIKAASTGYDVMLSNGYYIDLCKPASAHYLNDPLPDDLGLDAEARKHVLGGEATMWGELVTPETIDSRIWPRTCAIAERLWSPGSVNDVADMYRRLEGISLELEAVGLTHIKNREMMMRRLCKGADVTSLRTLLEVVEPLKVYARHHQGVAYSSELPLTRIPDMAIPDAPVARKFNSLVEAYLTQKDPKLLLPIEAMLMRWRNNHKAFLALADEVPALKEAVPLSEHLYNLAVIGLESQSEASGLPSAPEAQNLKGSDVIEAAKKPYVESEIVIADAVEKLIKSTK